jgi:hypothetical protein
MYRQRQGINIDPDENFYDPIGNDIYFNSYYLYTKKENLFEIAEDSPMVGIENAILDVLSHNFDRL